MRVSQKATYGAILFTGVFLGAAMAGFLFVVEPFLVAVLVGGGFLVYASSLKPQWVLALGLALSLAGGTHSAWTMVGGLILLANAVVGLAFLLSHRYTAPVGWLPALVLGWLMVRFLVEGDQETPADILRCAAVVIAVAACRARGIRLDVNLAVAGLGFVTASYVFGVSNAMGSRFVGVSGSPNRMVFGLLIFLPFIMTLGGRTNSGRTNSGRTNSGTVRTVAALGSVGSIVLVLRSGSSQGLVGLAVIAIGLVACFLSTRLRGSNGIFWCVSGAGIVLAVAASSRAIGSSSDLSTLSGRTPLYEAAVQEIGKHPWIGTGLAHVSADGVNDRSAHSAILGVTASGGVILGLIWVVILYRLTTCGISLLSRGRILGAVPLVLVVEQFVQAVEFIPLTWAVIAIFLTYDADRANARVRDSEVDGMADRPAPSRLTRERAHQ